MVCATAVAVAAAAAPARAGSLKPRVMVLPGKGAVGNDMPDDLARALINGAHHVTPDVARATASLSDTAVIVGCDPDERACIDAVAAALNVDQLLLIRIEDGSDGVQTVEVTAVGREAPPVTRRFPVRPATRKADLAAIEAAVPSMLDAEGHPSSDGSGGTGDPGGGAPGGGDPGGGGSAGSGDPSGGAGTMAPLPGGRDATSTRGPMAMTIAGGALAVVGLGAWTAASFKQGDIDAAPSSSAAELDRLVDLETSAKRYATAGNALVIVGGLTAAAGAVWWWRASRHGDTAAATSPASPATPAVTVMPQLGPGLGGLVVRGRW